MFIQEEHKSEAMQQLHMSCKYLSSFADQNEKKGTFALQLRRGNCEENAHERH